MRSSSNSGGGQRAIDRAQAEEPQRDRGPGQTAKRLFIVGLGPGHLDYLTVRARRAISEARVIAGYTTYVDLIRDLVADKRIIATAMKKEVDRVKAAIEAALAGDTCALVCSGDPGIYALAGLVLEICQQKAIPVAGPNSPVASAHVLCLEVVPGIPALASGAALLGAPLTHDFACVSLSDLLTPWETIEKRIDLATAADFVIVFFNPKSGKRDWQLARAAEIIGRHRSPDTPVGLVRNAMRPGQDVSIIALKDLATAEADMLTTVFVGNSATTGYLDFMFTPRGYAEKYDLSE